MKKYLLTITLVLFATISFAQNKIAYVDIMKIRESYSDFKNAETQFQKEMESVQKQVMSKEQEIQEKRKELEAQSMLLSEEKKAEKEKELQDMFRSYQQYIQEQEVKSRTREQELLAPVQEKLRVAIEKVAAKEGFDFVIDIANTYYANEAFNITNQVLRELSANAAPANK